MNNIFVLNPPSNEQQKSIEDINNYNIIVDSVAGSGKTTLSLHIGLNNQEKSILLLTFNAKLKLETREKISLLGLNNMEVHSYHSFCVKYYKRDCFTDYGILDVLKTENLNKKPLKPIVYDIIICDEAQDISPIYYKLICKIIKDNGKNIKICVMGDKNQSIYQFNKADERYIIFSDIILNTINNNIEWKKNKLSESFRITHEMAEFMNKVFLKEDRLISRKHNKKPKYIICDSFGSKYGTSNRLHKEIQSLLKEGYLYEDFFILAPSVKSAVSPIRQLANKISSDGIPIHVPVSDEEKLDEEILKNKIVFSTFHQVKGLERKIVMVFNMDESYFKYFKQDADPFKCPNEIYVACTRAKERLILIHHYENDYLPFIEKNELEKYCDFEKCLLNKKKFNNNANINTNVTDFIKHLPVEVIQEALKFIDIHQIQRKGEVINIPIKTKQKGLVEGVSEITGIAIPSYFEFKKTGKMSIHKFCKKNLEDSENNKEEQEINNNRSFFSDDDITTTTNNKKKEISNIYEEEEDKIIFEGIDINNIETHQLLYISNMWNSYKTGYIYKMKQIMKYDWLSNENLEKCIQRMDRHFSNNIEIEKGFVTEGFRELKNRKLIGYFDVIDDNKIWELKCVSKLENEHILQLGVYMYMFFKHNEKIKNSIVLQFGSLVLDDLESDNDKKKRYELEIEKYKESMFQLMSYEHLENDLIDIELNEKIYENCLVKKILKNEKIEIYLKRDNEKGYEKIKIIRDNIIQNHRIDKNMNLYMEKIKKTEEKIENLKNKKEYQEHKFYLYNILNDELLELRSDIFRLQKMIEYLIDHKYFTKNYMNDEEFIIKNLNYKDEIFNFQ